MQKVVIFIVIVIVSMLYLFKFRCKGCTIQLNHNFLNQMCNAPFCSHYHLEASTSFCGNCEYTGRFFSLSRVHLLLKSNVLLLLSVIQLLNSMCLFTVYRLKLKLKLDTTSAGEHILVDLNVNTNNFAPEKRSIAG